MSDRIKITAGLSALLDRHLSKGSERWAKEVRLWLPKECRVDYISVSCPNGAFARVGDVEAAKLTCYEVKSCMADFKSGHGLNDLGDTNYIVCPDELRRKFILDPDRSVGGWDIAVPCPSKCRSFANAIPYNGEVDGWRLHFFSPHPFGNNRKISIIQAMWAILCGGREMTNYEQSDSVEQVAQEMLETIEQTCMFPSEGQATFFRGRLEALGVEV